MNFHTFTGPVMAAALIAAPAAANAWPWSRVETTFPSYQAAYSYCMRAARKASRSSSTREILEGAAVANVTCEPWKTKDKKVDCMHGYVYWKERDYFDGKLIKISDEKMILNSLFPGESTVCYPNGRW